MGNKPVGRKAIKHLKAPIFCQIVMKNIYRLRGKTQLTRDFLGLADKMFIAHMRLKF